MARRRGGATHVFDSINHFFTIGQMIIVGSSYWNIGVGRDKVEVAEDAEGIEIMRDLGKNMAWILNKISELIVPIQGQGTSPCICFFQKTGML